MQSSQPLQAKPALPAELTKSLSKWIEETNAEVRQSQAIEPKPKPKAAEEEALKPKSSTPVWVEEFNEETEVLRSRAQLEEDAANGDDIARALLEEMEDEAVEATPDPAAEKNEPDWIAKAVAKQEAAREAMLANLDAPPLTLVKDTGQPKSDDQPDKGDATAATPPSTLTFSEFLKGPAAKSLATGLVLILSAIALNLG